MAATSFENETDGQLERLFHAYGYAYEDCSIRGMSQEFLSRLSEAVQELLMRSDLDSLPALITKRREELPSMADTSLAEIEVGLHALGLHLGMTEEEARTMGFLPP